MQEDRDPFLLASLFLGGIYNKMSIGESMRALLNHRTLLCCVVAQLFVVPRASSTDSTSAQAYIDKLRTFSIKVPSGWSVQEYNDPRTKVRFSLPSGTGKIAPSIFIISHSMTMEIDLEREAAMRIDRLRKMNAVDAGYEMVSFAGTHAAQMDATLPTGNIRMRNLMLIPNSLNFPISKLPALRVKWTPSWSFHARRGSDRGCGAGTAP